MENVIEHLISRIAKELGFEYAEKQAVGLLRNALDLRISSILRTLLSRTIHSSKYSANILNLLDVVKTDDLFVDTQLEPLLYEEPDCVKRHEYKSSLSTHMEKYIHIYDFMPPFPAIHTFRQTFSKNKEKLSNAELIKTRLEQSLKAEKNLLKLIELSNSMPNFVNYLYKK